MDPAITSLKKAKEFFHQIQKGEDETQVTKIIDELKHKKSNP